MSKYEDRQKNTGYQSRKSGFDSVDLNEQLREIEQDEREEEAEIARRKARREKMRRAELERKKRLTITLAAGIGGILALAILVGAGKSIHHKVEDKKAREAAEAQAQAQAEAEAKAAEEAAAAAAELARNSVRLSAVGDNLISQRLIDQAKERSKAEDGYDFSYVYADMEDFLADHEINWIDVETDINDEITPAGYPEFSTPGQDGIDLYQAGFNVFSLCNNHVYDLGTAGITAAQKFWSTGMPKGSKFVTCGLWKEDPDSKESFTENYLDWGYDSQFEVKYEDIPVYTCENGKKIAFLTYTQMTNSLDGGSVFQTPYDSDTRVIYLYEEDLIKAQIAKAHEMADAVVVGCHWGDEDTHEVNDYQTETAQKLADWGADLIIGDHLHVIQKAEMLKSSDGREVFCAYSLGNFVSTQEAPDELIGLALDCTLKFEEGKSGVTIEDPKLVPIVTDYGQDGSDSHVVLLSDYTDEQAKANGINGYIYDGTEFNLSYIRKILTDTIDGRYLLLEGNTEE